MLYVQKTAFILNSHVCGMISFILISLCWTEILCRAFVWNGKAFINVLCNNIAEWDRVCRSEWCFYFMALSPKIGTVHFITSTCFTHLNTSDLNYESQSIRSVRLWRHWDGERLHVVILKVVSHSSVHCTFVHTQVSSCCCRTRGFQTHFLCTTTMAWSSPTTMRR